MGVAAPALRRITATIGVEVEGIDLRRPLAAGARELLLAAIAEHHVVAVRDQHLSTEQHRALAESFGPLLRSPLQRLTGKPALSTIEDTAERPPAGFDWHTDLSWSAELPAIGFLCAVAIPPFGGDTLWASTAAIYDRLGPDDRSRCATASAVHVADPSLLATVARHHGAEVAARFAREQAPREQPLVRVDPRTGRRSVFLSPLYTERIAGPAGADGRLLARLNAMLDDPHVQMRWRWQPGDVVMWDEAATCHRALTDHFPQRRVVRRCVTAA